MGNPLPTDYQRLRLKNRRILFCLGSAFVVCSIIGVAKQWRYERAKNEEFKCRMNLHRIGQAILSYRNDHNNQYPAELGQLVDYPHEGVQADVFVCPSSSDIVLQTPQAQQTRSRLSSGHCSYFYVGAGLGSGRADEGRRVILFELPNHSAFMPKDGAVLYADGHSTGLRFGELVQLVPELEAGRNPPVFRDLTHEQAETIYTQRWLPKLASMKDGTWAAALPRPSTQPSAGPK